MFKKFLWLEWKAFLRSASFGTNLVIKIILGLGALYFSACFLMLGVGLYFIIKESLHKDPLIVVSEYLIYYLLADMVIRALLQKPPVINIRPLLTLPIKRNTVVNFALLKSLASFFNLLHVFVVVPFSIVLMLKGYSVFGVLLWWLGIWLLVYCNNFINLLINENDYIFVLFLAVLGGLGALQYFGYFNVTLITAPFFTGLYNHAWVILFPLVAFACLWMYTHKYFRQRMYLDTGLKSKDEIANTREYTFLDRFGKMGTFLKNDLRLILRNKRSRNTLFSGFMFLFYGLLFVSGGIEVYNNDFWKVFGGIFTTGGFLFTFGQFVPSWDSSYYPLMMSQNIKYRDYIASKWWLVVVATIVSTILSSFYLIFGLKVYMFMLVGAIYNIGVNAYIVLLSGAFIKTPIDLMSAKRAFGDSKSFNIKVMLLAIPKMLIPVILFVLGKAIHSPEMGYAFVAGAGIAGLAFRNKVFNMIERTYKTEKYTTLEGYKQKN
ncbi:DUF5687 family protein [Flavobacterium sp. RHBU_3]|uniref:DUF5687 family protein n=1 Tax=Flavobacterium sp. RHBU_3 TaxID=3391184 RepID=UPI0039855CAE